MWPKPIDHVFLLCDPAREPDRAAYLTNWLRESGIPPECYTMGLACYGDTLADEDALRVYNPLSLRYSPDRGQYCRNLKKSEISLVLNWAAAARQAVDRGFSVVMILESDVLFFPEFLTNLSVALKAAPAGWDFLSLSAGANLRPRRPADSTELGWFPPLVPYYHTRTTDAMIFRVPMLKNILGTLFPFSDVLDWELNYQLSRHVSKSWWLDPPIVRQGSGNEYPTSL